MSIRVFQSEPAEPGATAYGAQRVFWWIATLGAESSGGVAANYNNWYTAARTSGALTVTNGNGTVIACAMGWNATQGRYMFFAHGGAAGSITQLVADTRIASALFMNAPLDYEPLPAVQVIVLREVFQFLAALPAVGGSLFGGGFVLGASNTFAGANVGSLATGAWFRGIGITYDTFGFNVFIKDSPANITRIPLTANFLDRTLVEHRLYMPTLTTPGRYELRVADVLVATVQGDHASFPQPASLGEKYQVCPFIRDNVAGLAVGKQSYFSEIFAGPDVDGLFDG